jgi:FlaA1/EpsC-like NDP-sugar epimerase
VVASRFGRKSSTAQENSGQATRTNTSVACIYQDMIPNTRQFVKYLAKLFDLSALAVSIAIALIVFTLPKGMTLAGSMAMKIKLGNCLAFALLLLVWHNVFIFCGLYVSKRLTRQFTQIAEVFKATTLAVFLLFVSAKAFHLQIVSPRFALLFWLLTTFMMVAGRIAARWLLLALRSRGKNTRFILIVGTNERAIEFVRQIASHPELGYHGWNPSIRLHGSNALLHFCRLGQFSSP